MLRKSNLFILESGMENKTSIVFLHGVCASSNMWLHHMKALKNFHCVAPDFPGHGKSNQYQWTTIDQVTEWIAEIIKTKCHNRAHIVGLSLGGAVGLNLLNKYPAVVDRAIIDGCGTRPIRGSRLAVFGAALVSPFIRTSAIIKVVERMIGIGEKDREDFTNDMKKVRSKSFRRAVRDANVRQLLPDNVSHIKSPVLFVSGEREPGITHETHRIFSSLIPGSKCLYYPGKGHGWVGEDLETHIDMCRWWFGQCKLPSKLVACKEPTSDQGQPKSSGASTTKEEIYQNEDTVANIR